MLINDDDESVPKAFLTSHLYVPESVFVKFFNVKNEIFSVVSIL